jgi:hypothetical protein
MVVVVVTDENSVHLSKANISAAGDCDARIIENPDSGWVFKYQCTIETAILPGSRPQGRDLNRTRLLCHRKRAHNQRRQDADTERSHGLLRLASHDAAPPSA